MIIERASLVWGCRLKWLVANLWNKNPPAVSLLFKIMMEIYLRTNTEPLFASFSFQWVVHIGSIGRIICIVIVSWTNLRRNSTTLIDFPHMFLSHTICLINPLDELHLSLLLALRKGHKEDIIDIDLDVDAYNEWYNFFKVWSYFICLFCCI